jgi:hypothetical protein
MNSLEELLLNMGCSWQMSMLLPFLILFILGFLLGFLLLNKRTSRMLKLASAFTLAILAAGIYFSFYPIYVSDLNNEFRVENHAANNERNEGFLEVLVLPDCPHCIYSTDLVKKLALRNADAQIVYKIISKDGYGGGIEEKLKTEGLKYTPSRYDEDIRILAKGSFPSFVFHEKDAKQVQVWNNNTFGSKALDYIESKLKID